VKKVLLLLLLCVTVINSTAFSAADAGKARDFYNNGRYSAAAKIYKDMLSNGYDKGMVYFNLANCYFKTGKYVDAIYYYEKAKQLRPLDKRIIKNLDIVKAKADIENTYNIERGLFFFAPVDILKIGFLVFLTLLLLDLSYINIKKRSNFVLIFILLLFVIDGTMLFYKIGYEKNVKFGIVRAATNLYAEPRAESEAKEQLAAGSRVKILEDFNNYFRVKINKDLTGWLKKSKIEGL